MVSIVDFESWSVVLPAVLTGGAAVMSWRGAVLSGDRTRKHSVAWGVASTVTFGAALLAGAIANHDANEGLHQAVKDKMESDSKLIAIQKGVDDLKRVVSPDNNSNIDVLALALQKLKVQQGEINKLRKAVRLDNHVYQEGQDRAIVGKVGYDQNSGVLVFGLLTAQAPIDFSTELEFQWARIHCDDKQPYGSAAMGAALNLQYSRVTCRVVGRLDANDLINPPVAPPPSPTPSK
jgi:hypothetical protein